MPDRHVLSVTFDAPRDIATLDLLPYNDRRATVPAVEVQGRRFAVEPGWNRLAVDLQDVKTLTVRIAARAQAGGRDGGRGRDPRAADRRAARARGAAAADPRRARRWRPAPRSRTCSSARPATTRSGARRSAGPAGAALVRDRLDAETGLTRVLQPAHRPHVHGRRLGERAPRAPRTTRSTASSAARRASRAPPASRAAPAPRVERVRRHVPAVARRVSAGPHEPGSSGTARSRRSRRSTLDPVAGVRRPTRVRLVVDGVPIGAVARPRTTSYGCPRPVTGPSGSGSRSSAPAATRRRRGSAEPSASPRSTAPGRGPTCPRSGALSRECVLVGHVAQPPLPPARARARSRTSTRAARSASTGCDPIDLPAGADAPGAPGRACSRRTCCACARARAPRRPRPAASSTRAARARTGTAPACASRCDAPGPARARRELQPRPPRDVRRPGPGGAGGRRGLRHGLARPGDLPRRGRSRSGRTAWCSPGTLRCRLRGACSRCCVAASAAGGVAAGGTARSRRGERRVGARAGAAERAADAPGGAPRGRRPTLRRRPPPRARARVRRVRARAAVSPCSARSSRAAAVVLLRALPRDRGQAARAGGRRDPRDRGADPHDPDPAREPRRLQPRVPGGADRRPLGRRGRHHAADPRAGAGAREPPRTGGTGELAAAVARWATRLSRARARRGPAPDAPPSGAAPPAPAP